MGLGKRIWPVVALLCLVGAGPARAAAPPSMTWSPPEAIDAGTTVAGTSITGLSCPTTSLCVGVDAGGNAFWSTDPAAVAPSWTRVHIATAELTAVTCPTTVLCVAVGADGSIHTSTTPTAGAVAWSAVAGEPGTSFYDVACAGTTSCVAVGSVMTTGERARVATSANPTGGPGSWTAQTIGPATDNALNGVSCPTTTLCVASSDAGYLATATNPADTWIAHAPVTASLDDVACGSATMCLAVGGDKTFLSTAPTGSWTASTGMSLNRGAHAVSCPTSALCAISGAYSEVRVITNPGTAQRWVDLQEVDTSDRDLRAVTCVDATFCATAGDSGYAYVTTDPANSVCCTYRRSRASGAPRAAAQDLTAISCDVSPRCVATDAGGDAAASDNPAGGATAWHLANVSDNRPAGPVSCMFGGSAWRRFPCIAAGGPGRLLASSHPESPDWGWGSYHSGFEVGDTTESISALDCTIDSANVSPDQPMCVAFLASGALGTTPFHSWNAGGVPLVARSFAPDVRGVSCPVASLCVAVNSHGNVYASDAPLDGRPWSSSHIFDGELTDVACTATPVCVATTSDGRVLVTHDPFAAPAGWAATMLPGAGELVAASCSGPDFCAVIDGAAVYVTRPSLDAGAWERTPLAAIGSDTLSDVACIRSRACFVVGHDGDLRVGVPTDTTPPAITVTVPGEGQRFIQGSTVAATVACTDEAAMGQCNHPAHVDTSQVGAHTFTVFAADEYGNYAFRTVGYVVQAATDGGTRTPGGQSEPTTVPPRQSGTVVKPPTRRAPPVIVPKLVAASRTTVSALVKGLALRLAKLRPRSRIAVAVRWRSKTLVTARATAKADGRAVLHVKVPRRKLVRPSRRKLTLRISLTTADGVAHVLNRPLAVR